MNKKTIISIIVVTYNCGIDLIETLKSIDEQTYKNYEVIFVDGISSDSTLDIIREYCNKKDNCKFISERDLGIYDAMNKGIKLANGEIIYYLNAKDQLYDANVLKNIYEVFKNYKVDIVYGDYVQSNQNSFKEISQYFPFGDAYRVIWAICHQSLFVRKNVFEKIGNFNIKYKISADNEWLTRCLINGIKFKYIKTKICFYDMNGFSSKNSKIGLEENNEYSLVLLHGKYRLMYYIKKIYRSLK